MAFYVYILRCADDSYYTGHTENLEARVAAHHLGRIPGYTALRRPVKLVFSQDFPSREQALTAERQIKGWKRVKKEALIRNQWDLLPLLAMNSERTSLQATLT